LIGSHKSLNLIYNKVNTMDKIKFIDLFCGIGGFRTAMDQACIENNLFPECVFSSDIDTFCQKSYQANFGHRPVGDITKVDEKDIPDHDILFAGFPCQPFSIIGQMQGFNDIRGTLFFDIARILKHKRPKAFILENVKQLVGHDGGKTLKTILRTLEKELGYNVQFAVLNALDYGLPQKRERVIIVGHQDPIMFSFPSPVRPFKPLSEILEKQVDIKHLASDYIVQKRKEKHKSAYKLSIWHENKAGNICSYPYSCALRAGASYNYLLVNGERRLTPREMLRLQGFPDNYKIVVNDGQARKQAGNAVPVNIVKAVILKLLPFVATSLDMTLVLREYEVSYGK
jgi:DNA (cytosine-5)-methyltransferase 1